MHPYPENPDDRHKAESELAGCSFGMPTDELIAEVVAASVLGHPQIRGGYLEVEVQNRVVILLGEVTSADARTTIRRLAWAVPGVHDVCNRLRVAVTGHRTGVEPKRDDET